MPAYDQISEFLNAQHRTLVSVFPLECSRECRHATMEPVTLPDGSKRMKLGGIKRYVLPAAPKGGFSKLVVTGASDIGMDLLSDPPVPLPRPIPADDIANDLLIGFTLSNLDATVTRGPGIFIATEPDPTDEQIAASPKLEAARAKQEEYFRDLIHAGEELHARGKPVTNLHRLAAIWMGAEDRAWAKEITEKRTKACAACGESILSAATVCRYCQTNLVTWAMENSVEQASDPVVWARVQALQAQQSRVASAQKATTKAPPVAA
jgi:hypothetical protein